MIVLNDHIEHHLRCLKDDDDSVENEVKVSFPEQNEQNEVDIDATDETHKIDQKRSLLCDRSELRLLCSHSAIGIIGYISGASDTIVRKTLTWTCIMISLFAWYQTCHILQKRSNQRRCEQQTTDRLELIKLLGTVGASVSSIRKQDGLATATRLLPLAHALVNVLQDMVQAMEVVRMMTGMRLEVGPFSPSVERMDLSTTKPSLAKRLLAETMIHQRTALLRLIALQKEETDTPAVVTIQWLKETHRELCCLLSDVIDDHLNFQTKYGETKIREAITEASEASSYLTGIFGFTRPKTLGRQPASHTKQQLEAAHAALWAFEHETEPEIKQEWCERFHILLSNLRAHALNEMLQRQDTKLPVTSFNLTVGNIEINGATSHRSKIDHYEHVIQPNSDATLESKTEKRVLIFSGKGKSNRLPRKNLKDNMIEQYSVVQSQMLSELHNRLAVLDTAEEVDANEISDDERENYSIDCHTEQTSAALPILSNDESNILSELHLALASTQVLDDALSFS